MNLFNEAQAYAQSIASEPSPGEVEKRYRENFLFANTPGGARASAIIFSIIETAKEYALNPFDYLLVLFRTMLNQLDLDMDALLPDVYRSGLRP